MALPHPPTWDQRIKLTGARCTREQNSSADCLHINYFCELKKLCRLSVHHHIKFTVVQWCIAGQVAVHQLQSDQGLRAHTSVKVLNTYCSKLLDPVAPACHTYSCLSSTSSYSEK